MSQVSTCAAAGTLWGRSATGPACSASQRLHKQLRAASGKPLKIACVQCFENLYPTPLQNKDIIQDVNCHSMLKYMFIMSVREVFQNYVYSRAEGGC